MKAIIDGFEIVKRQSEAWAVYDANAHEIVAYAPGHFWSLAKSKALRERGSGHLCYYVAMPKWFYMTPQERSTAGYLKRVDGPYPNALSAP